MSYKTDRLVDLFPDAYAAHERSSLLYTLLDAIGAELMRADEQVKQLLKSHWVRYAEGSALDGLGAIFGVTRRVLPDGQSEPDKDFRQRLQETVILFTGGGTREAVLGAVRSALGLPYDLNRLRLPEEFNALRSDIKNLITMTEFSPDGDTVLENTLTPVGDGKTVELILNVTTPTVNVKEVLPRIEWTFADNNSRKSSGRLLTVERLDTHTGVKSKNEFLMPPGSALVLSDDNGRLSAVLNGSEIGHQFVNLDGSAPAKLPPVPNTPSQWRFRAQTGGFDHGRFDEESFDLPLFRVGLSRLIFQPLTFDVHVPFFFDRAIEELKLRHNYPGEIRVFRGISLGYLQEVVDQTRAAGVRGSVVLTLNFFDNHTQDDRTFNEKEKRPGFVLAADYSLAEKQDAQDLLLVANINQQTESHPMADRLNIVGVFDNSPFDGPFGFL